jgi:hypothetical protein
MIVFLENDSIKKIILNGKNRKEVDFTKVIMMLRNSSEIFNEFKFVNINNRN